MTRPAGRVVSPGELKALVRQLVKAAGGVEACGVELGVSAERVSQYQRPTCDDQMPLLFIHRLEAVVGRGVVTGALARAAEGEGVVEAIGAASVEAIGSAADLIAAVHQMEADGKRTAAEVQDVQAKSARMLREAQEAHDSALRLSATSEAG
jgi:hypothetical protein